MVPSVRDFVIACLVAAIFVACLGIIKNQHEKQSQGLQEPIIIYPWDASGGRRQ
jgi:hypothetical protein